MTFLTDATILEMINSKTSTFLWMFLGAVAVIILFTVILILAGKKKKFVAVLAIAGIVASIYFAGIYMNCLTGFENESFVVTKDYIKSKSEKDNKCTVNLQVSKLSKELDSMDICKNDMKGETVIVVMVPFRNLGEEKLTIMNVFSPKTHTYTGERFVEIEKIKDLY